ncbi:hypothetical protein [Nocardia camponoti]|uniref:Uncharacterized protein n=1 Tax=Nocardia camponoti TaxID=1616106 RepID=A0A917VBP5_9NOCA|nr:hypothetical protein [Nocardia camponoti]GGK62103.1 hypothetical protein GCM10011591_37970 [Nocardia camponoti]
MTAPLPGPIFDVIAVLNGVVDLRNYPRRHLVLSAPPSGGFVFGTDGYQRALLEPIVHLTNGIELLESQGWELVSVVTPQLDRQSFTVAFMRRTGKAHLA